MTRVTFLYGIVTLIILFIISTMTKLNEVLLLNASVIWQEPYRFFTAILVHGSVGHVLQNCVALFLFGIFVENLFSPKKMWIVFFTAGIIANIISVFFYPLSLGASGAIYGLIGMLGIARPQMPMFAMGFPMPMWLALIAYAAVDTFGLFIPDGTGNIAHLSGLAVGMIFGFYHRKKVHTKPSPITDEQVRNWEEQYMR